MRACDKSKTWTKFRYKLAKCVRKKKKRKKPVKYYLVLT